MLTPVVVVVVELIVVGHRGVTDPSVFEQVGLEEQLFLIYG